MSPRPRDEDPGGVRARDERRSDMQLSELRQALERGRSADDWTNNLARFFAAHDLGYGHGTDNPRDEAYWLIRARQGWSADAWAEAPDPGLIDTIVDTARRRVSERRPLAYLLGEAWFAGLRFSVDGQVLIPRSPLAELIEQEFRPWCRLEPHDRVLDIGTGSGCLAVATAHYCAHATVDATDVSAGALAVARRNVRCHGLEDRVRLFQADLFDGLPGPYRIIMANPPYVPSARVGELPAEYGHEPELALDGGANGLDIVDRLVAGAADRLTQDGLLIVEVGEVQPEFQSRYKSLPATWLEFERGGDGVLLLTREELTGYLTD